MKSGGPSRKSRAVGKSTRRDDHGKQEELVWGINPVREELAAGNLGEIVVQKGKGGPRIQEIVELARKQGLRLRFVNGERMGVSAGCRHQGVVGRRSAAVLLPFSSMIEQLAAETGDTCRLLILDCIQDPGNLGSILRSALAAGFAYVLIPRQRSAPISGTVARASAGAVAHLHISQVNNLVEAIKELKERGFWVYGAVLTDDAASIYETDFSGRVALVVGSEGKGIRPLVRKQCDHLVTIPMQGDFDSLNVSVAAAVIMFEIVHDQKRSNSSNV